MTPKLLVTPRRSRDALRVYWDVLEELDVADPPSVLGEDVVADDSEELRAGGAGAGVAGVVDVVDSDRVVESIRVSGDAEGATRCRERRSP